MLARDRARSWAPASAIRWRSITDGRFSGATRGLMAGHVAPEAARGGPIAAVRDGDIITLRCRRPRTLSVERQRRRARRRGWRSASRRRRGTTTGVMAQIRAAGVVARAQGAITA